MRKPRITIDDNEMETLLWWIFDKDPQTKPRPEEFDTDKSLMKKLRRACEKLGMGDELDEYINPPESEEDIERKEQIKEMSDINGIFRCSKCNVRTNQKTPQTECVVCKTPLMRG